MSDLLMVQNMESNTSASLAAGSNPILIALKNLQMIISAIITCQRIFMAEHPDLRTTANTEEQCDSNAAYESDKKSHPKTFRDPVYNKQY